MSYSVSFLPRAEKYLVKLDEKAYEQIEEHIEGLKKDPYRRRPLANIKKLGGFKSPPMYRLRVGRHRLEYFVEEETKTICVTDAFLRSSDSDYR